MIVHIVHDEFYINGVYLDEDAAANAAVDFHLNCLIDGSETRVETWDPVENKMVSVYKVVCWSRKTSESSPTGPWRVAAETDEYVIVTTKPAIND